MSRLTAFVATFLLVLGIAGSSSLEASKTFTGGPTTFTLPLVGTGDPSGAPGAVYPVSIPVSGLLGTIRNVRLQFFVSHTFLADVDVVLVGPGGQSFVVMSDVGSGANVAGAEFVFSDAADAVPVASGPVSGGVYRPTNYGTGDVFPAPAPVSFSNAAPAGSATFASVFGGLNPNGTWKVYTVDDTAGDVGHIGSVRISISTTGDPDGVIADFDGNGATDWTVLRVAPGGGAVTWYAENSAGFSALQWGDSTLHDTFVAGDFDGDAKSDPVVCGPREDFPSTPSTCWLHQSYDGEVAQPWGLSADSHNPVGDFDGDGRTDLVAFRDGVWYSLASASKSLQVVQFGLTDDHAQSADVDGDGRSDQIVVRPSGGSSTTYVLGSKSGFQAISWGLSTDLVLNADYDGDGKSDVVALRGSAGGDPIQWYIRRSSDGGLTALTWGVQGTDFPVLGDYDHDGKQDVGVYRLTTGVFYIRKSSTGTLLAMQWGVPGDLPFTFPR